MMSAYPLSSETDPAKLLNNAIEDLAMALYELVFSAVNSLINRSEITVTPAPPGVDGFIEIFQNCTWSM